MWTINLIVPSEHVENGTGDISKTIAIRKYKNNFKKRIANNGTIKKEEKARR